MRNLRTTEGMHAYKYVNREKTSQDTEPVEVNNEDHPVRYI